MKKYLLIAVSSWLVGIIFADRLLLLLPYVLIALLIACAVFGFMGRKEWIALCLCFVFAAPGCFYMSHFRTQRDALVSESVGEHTVLGRIVSKPKRGENALQFTFKTESLDNKPHSAKIQMIIGDSDGAFEPEFGQRLIIFDAEISEPSVAENPANFDYRTYLSSKGIYLSGYAYYNSVMMGETPELSPVERLRDAVSKHLGGAVSAFLSEDAQGFVLGILLGDTFDMSEESMENLRTSGIIHIVCVSGLHVSILLMFLMRLFGMFSYRVRNIIALVGIGIFLLLIGGQVSAIRAGVMAAIAALAVVFNRENDSLTSIAVAALVVTLMNPFSIYNTGFQLSFGTTLGLVLFARPISGLFFHRVPRFLRDTLSVTVAAQLTSIPFILYHYQYLSLYSIMANLMITGIFTLLFCLAFVFALLGSFIPFIGKGLAFLINPLVKYILWVAEACSELPFARINLPRPTVAELICYGLVILLLYALIKHWKKIPIYCILGAFCCLLCYNVYEEAKPLKYLEATYLSVGEGDASLIRTRDKQSFLIDGGGGVGYDTAERNIIPTLLSKRVLHLDGAVVSHYHDDHAEGILSLIGQFKIGRLYLPTVDGSEICVKLHNAAREHGIPVTHLKAGVQIKISEDVMMRVLWPRELVVDEENDRSLVLDIVFDKQHFLYAGDITASAEEELSIFEGLMEPSVLKVSHHGSDGSTSDVFLDAFPPQNAVISVGKNSYGHPGKKTMERLQNHRVSTYLTSESGAVTVYADGRHYLEIETFKE